MPIEFPNYNNPFFQTAAPVTFQMQAWEESAKRRAAAQGAQAPSPQAPAAQATAQPAPASGTASGGAAAANPTDIFKSLQTAVTALGDVLSKGQNVNQALGNLAQVLASFSQSITQPQSGAQPTTTTQPNRVVNPNGNPAPAPPLGIAPPNPRSQHIQLPPGTERAGLPPQPPMKPEPPIGLYPQGAGAPVFWTQP